MHKWVMFSSALLAFAVSTPVHAQTYSWLSSTGPNPVVTSAPAQITSPVQSTFIHGTGKHGYPFTSGCCEAKTPCCQGLWADYCGGNCFGGCLNRCRTSCPLPKGKGHARHFSGRFLAGFSGCGGCGFGYGHSTCGGCVKGGCAKGGCGKGGCATGRCGKGYSHGFGWATKGGCSSCGHMACMGTCGCNSCGHHRLGLFDWMHRSHGKACGCSRCSHGKGHVSYSKGCSSCGGHRHSSPTQVYDHPIQMHSAPSVIKEAPALEEAPTPAPSPAPALEAPTPPQVHVEPMPASEHSARVWFFSYPGQMQQVSF